MTGRFDLAIFDCDGVLIDSEWIACAVDAEVLSECGYPITTQEVVSRFAGVPGPQMMAEIEAELGKRLPADISSRIATKVAERYKTDLKPINGVAETLGVLDIAKCVASSSAPEKLTLSLIQTGLFDLFYPHIYSASLVPVGKPEPDIFLFAARQKQVEPKRCVVIEDSVAGVKAARAAGMYTVGFIGGTHCLEGHESALTDAGAHVVMSAFNQLEIIMKYD